MNQSEIKKGFDAPKYSKDEDLLNRWGFAKEIYSLAINTPNEWSVRIGIFAKWGEGKSTVLGFIDNMANQDNHLCLQFNPWEFNSNDELWENLITDIIGKLNDKDIKIENLDGIQKRIQYNKFLREKSEILKGVEDVPYVGKMGLHLLKIFLSDNKKMLKELGQSLKDNRFVVILDDLDRASPKVVPQILFALREILDLPGFSFILAFDPNIVSKALLHHHIGFDDTLDFLDKILDFQKWLPPPSDEDLIRLLKKDVDNYCNFIPFDAIRNSYKFLPKNPRSLRKFIRSFLGFDKELYRYDTGEIDWAQFILVQSLKNSYPIFTYDLVADSKLWDEIFTDKWLGERRSGPEPKDSHKDMIRDLCNKNRIVDKYDIDKIIDVIDLIAKRDQTLSNIDIKKYLLITESPAIFTQKEFNSFLQDYEKNKSKAFIKEFLVTHSNKFDFDESVVLKNLFLMTINYRLWSLNESATSTYETKLKDHLNDSILALDIIEKISFDLSGFVGNNPILDSKDFKRLYDMMAQWLSVTHPKENSSLRKIEKIFLINLASAIEGNLIQILSELTPWMSERIGVYDSKAEKVLSEKISKILEYRICENILNNFKEYNWVLSIENKGDHLAEHYLLFRLDSPLWKGESKKNFFKMLDENIDNDVVRRNVTEFLFLFNDSLFEMYDAGEIFNHKSILHSKSIIIKIWKYVLISKLNSKMFNSFDRLKTKIEEKFKYKLPTPKWWTSMKKIRDKRLSHTEGA